MPEHITNSQLEAVMDRFNEEYPNGDSADLARYMFNLGFEAGEQGGLGEVNFSKPMPRTVTATSCSHEAFLAHDGERFEIVRYWDGSCYVNRYHDGEPVETPAIPEFAGYGEISGRYASVYGINLPKAKDLAFGPAGCHKQYAYAIIK